MLTYVFMMTMKGLSPYLLARQMLILELVVELTMECSDMEEDCYQRKIYLFSRKTHWIYKRPQDT